MNSRGENFMGGEIYSLMDGHPDGMTRDEIWAELRTGWAATDAYRAYNNRIEQQREASADSEPSAEYGTALYKERAQKWWISQTLANMARRGTARRDGDRWFANRPPRIRNAGADPRKYVTLDAAAHEEVKARVRADLRASQPTRAQLLETLRLVDAYLSGQLS